MSQYKAHDIYQHWVHAIFNHLTSQTVRNSSALHTDMQWLFAVIYMILYSED
jgi:hypothetical protein